jgi:hypothetical protein
MTNYDKVKKKSSESLREKLGIYSLGDVVLRLSCQANNNDLMMLDFVPGAADESVNPK